MKKILPVFVAFTAIIFSCTGNKAGTQENVPADSDSIKDTVKSSSFWPRNVFRSQIFGKITIIFWYYASFSLKFITFAPNLL